MAKKNAADRLKALIREIPTHDEVMVLLTQLSGHAGHAFDRAIALVGAALIEDGLQFAIRGALVPLQKREISELFFKQDAPMGTFYRRTNVAYSMGIVGPKTKHDLTKIREIRNAFAHGAIEIEFNTNEVAALTRKLLLIKDSPSMTPRSAYIETVAFVSEQLRRTLQHEIEMGRTKTGWTWVKHTPPQRHLP